MNDVENKKLPDYINVILKNSESVEDSNSDINLLDVFKILIQYKHYLIVGIIFSVVIAILLVLIIPKKYTSTALLSPIEESNGGGLAGLASQFGSIANLAGINLGSSSKSKEQLAIEILRSRDFIKGFIDKHELLVPLMASSYWNPDNDQVIINKNIYNEENEEWVRDVSYPFKPKPSDIEAHEKFLKIFDVFTDKETGLVTLAITDVSPKRAALWVELLIKEINLTMKNADVSEATSNIKYLEKQIDATSVRDMQKVFYQLIEEQTKTIMLANVREEYIFKTIDSPLIPLKHSKPNNLFIVLIVFVLGIGISLLTITVVNFYRMKRKEK